VTVAASFRRPLKKEEEEEVSKGPVFEKMEVASWHI
jgi:hypothetical protein